ncbi:DUF6087 family protein [Streptomyces sp. AcE210]|uniref:DUF6087 family protein n=1 Tax=Streptomyces sp. AcE210 TaxID=2292703 RepID=UPI001F0C2FAC|nr:DUF6087 family protein [Streptomyces sp. AcE210]
MRSGVVRSQRRAQPARSSRGGGRLPSGTVTPRLILTCALRREPHFAIQEFNGTEWVTVSIADSLDAAKPILYPPVPVEERPVPGPSLGKGRGRHRRTAPPKDATS